MSIPEVSSRPRLLHFLKKYLVLDSVSFCATMTSPQTISRTTLTTVEFDTETYAGTGYDTSTYTFVAPYAGKYFFSTNITWHAIASTIDIHAISLMHNSTTHYIQWDNRNGGGAYYANNGVWTDSGSTILDLSRGDTVKVQAYYDDSTPVASESIFGSATNRYTTFLGYKL